MLWNSMEMPCYKNLCRNPTERRTLTRNGELMFISGKKLSYCTVAVLNTLSSAPYSLAIYVLVLFCNISFRDSEAVSVDPFPILSKGTAMGQQFHLPAPELPQSFSLARPCFY